MLWLCVESMNRPAASSPVLSVPNEVKMILFVFYKSSGITSVGPRSQDHHQAVALQPHQ